MQKEKKNTFFHWLKENLKALLWAAVIALGIRSFAAEPFNIPTGSMVPSLLVGDYLFVSKYSYGFSRYSLPLGLPLIPGRIFYTAPQRGDVVVFKLPSDNKTDYIKRVIGLPGDQIQMINGRLHINGKEVPRSAKGIYFDESSNRYTTLYDETLPNGFVHEIIEVNDYQLQDNTDIYTVPEGFFFMMGDNRDNSKDSRFPDIGMIPMENLVGKAQFIFYSNNGYAPFLAFWSWGKSIRTERLFKGIH